MHPRSRAPLLPCTLAPKLPYSRAQKGQTMAEFTLVMPILILLLFGMTYAAFYAFRAASVDWGIFVHGVAAGAYKTPAMGIAGQSTLWPELQSQISASQFPDDRLVRSQITVTNIKGWVYGINLIEAQHGTTFFRRWRFYPGPPTGAFE
ncbi:MAG: pilus assembly protein [Chloroflexi bacterium]|nr:pilus assembly protein [Chloroflexota bacterium]